MMTKNYKGAIEIVSKLLEANEPYRVIARMFGHPDHQKTMIGMFMGNNWTNDDIGRWKVALKKFEEFKQTTRKTLSTDNTIVISKQKKR